jgi:hypothetical protein
MKKIFLLGDSNASFLMMTITGKDTRLGYASQEYNGFNIVNIENLGEPASRVDFNQEKFNIIKNADKNNSTVVLMYGTVDTLLGIDKSETIESVVENYVNKAVTAFAGFDILFVQPVKQPDPELLKGYRKQYALNKMRRNTFNNVSAVYDGFWANLQRVCQEKGLRSPLEIGSIIDTHGPFNRMSPEMDNEFFTPTPEIRNNFLHLNVATSTAIVDAITNTLK